MDNNQPHYPNYTGDFFALFIICKEQRKFKNLCKESKEIVKEKNENSNCFYA